MAIDGNRLKFEWEAIGGGAYAATVSGAYSGWDMALLVVGVPTDGNETDDLDSAWEIIVNVRFDGKPYGMEKIVTDAGDQTAWETLLRNDPSVMDLAIGAGIVALQDHLNLAYQQLGMRGG